MLASLAFAAWFFLGGLLYFGQTPPEQDFTAAYNEHARRAAGAASADENQWARYERLLATVVVAEEVIAGQSVLGPEGQFRSSLDVGGVLDRGVPADDRTSAVLAAFDNYRRAGVFDQAAMLADHAPAVRQVTGSLLDVDTPDLAIARQLARIQFIRFVRAYRMGDENECGSAATQAIALADVLLHQPRLIDRLTGVAIVAGVCEQIREQAAASPPSPAMFGVLLPALRAVRLPPLGVVVEGERLTALDTIQRTLPAGSPLRFTSRGAQMAKIDELYRPLISAIDGPLSARNAAEDAYSQGVDALPKSYAVCGMLLVSWAGLFESHDRMDATLGGTVTMLAIEAYIRDKDVPPESLAALIPEYLPELPTDHDSNRPFAYERVMAPGPQGPAYRLYSVGADGADNGGMFDADQPHRAFSRTKGAGLDYDLTGRTPPTR